MLRASTDLIALLAPTGVLRAAINLGNPILAGRDASGCPVGVSVDLTHRLASQLGLPIELVVFDAAGKAVEAVTNDQADIGFFAVDPVRGAGISFTAPYILIEGAYLVREDSLLCENSEVDRPEHRVTVGLGSAYDLYLTRELRHAQLERAQTSPAVVETFLSTGAHVAAGVKQQLEADMRRRPGLRLLPGRFMVIHQAMGLPKTRGPEAGALLFRFVEDAKRDDFIAQSLAKHDIEGASVAPPAKS